MKSLIPLPHTRAYVHKRFLRQLEEPEGVIECYLVAVCVVLNEAPKLMVMTHEGAMFCYVPPNAITFDPEAELLQVGDVCSWDCLANAAEIVEIDFLRHYSVEWTDRHGKKHEGAYLWTLHFDPKEAWGRLPEQLKLFHFVKSSVGRLHIIVNNQTRWVSEFIDKGELQFKPQSNWQVWFSE